jgi:hypothetical protein
MTAVSRLNNRVDVGVYVSVLGRESRAWCLTGTKHTNTSATSIIQQPHALCLGSLLLLPSLLVIVLVINHPVRPDEVDPGPDLLNQLVQRLLVLAVVARGLLAKLRDRVSS